MECETLSTLVAAAKAGRSQVLVLRGEAGIGKTALLDVLLGRAAGCRVARAAGVESEMELAFAGLHQLCSPYLDRLGKLPDPQQEALGTAFGLRPGSTPDRFLVGLAVLALLSEVAEERPLVCVVDDAQWLDRASGQALEFVARRLVRERVAMVFAVCTSDQEPRLSGLPELAVRGLGAGDAATLLESSVPGVLDPRVRDRILAESHGNPLALLELPRGLSAADLSFGGGIGHSATPLVQRLEQGFLRQAAPLPPQSLRLLLTAAAEPVGDVQLLWRAAERLGIGSTAAAAAEASGLIELHDRVRFRHPLVRSAVYRSATPAERREVHRALSDVTDPEVDPDRRAWHRSRAAVGPDEDVAAELERSAGRAFSHGGLAAAAAFLEQSAALTSDPARRAGRCLDAAQAKVHAGALGDAAALVATADGGPLADAERARVDLLRAEISFAANRGNEALPLLLPAARRLEPLDARLSRDTYLDALSAALFAGRLAAGPGARQVAEAVRAAPTPDAPRKGDVLLAGLAALFTDGYGSAAPLLRRAVRAFVTDELTLDEALRSAWLAAATAASLWDHHGWDVLTRRHLDVARESGALSALPLALHTRALVHLFTGDLTTAASLVEEARFVTEVTRSSLAPYGEVGLLAVRGDAAQAEPLIQRCLEDVTARGEGAGATVVQWARAVLCNGLGRYGDALRAAREAAARPLELGPPKWALAELVEAGVRTGDTEAAVAALEELSTMTRTSGTEWGLGIAASRRALLSGGRTAEGLHLEALDRLERTSVRVELARARLLYGEWLRREGRRVDARTQLRSAHEAFTAMGVDAFAERARHELLATGETVRRRTVETLGELTAQEVHIARLAAQGLTNREIGAELYLSPRTVEWHLRKVFAKLGVGTRRELRRSLPRSTP
ncbi:regulatory protein, luxR family [Geodermatophilus siccatus]|uniref:Regulatory protein, luxR family n=2 Tax=Geodermatophilus siccatus TaxID=1137991 RepID=A0A1G9NLE6_9ACTN|nr:regulatory protein, luxR family [Geodermatophilus siccatus]